MSEKAIHKPKSSGRKDKNGIEICAGDILSSGVRVAPRVCEVYIEDGVYCVKYEPHDFKTTLEEFIYFNSAHNGKKIYVEIIGNTKENFELIQDKKLTQKA